MVLALNMYDIAQRQGLRIDLDGLARDLGCPIVTTVATRKRGIDDLLAQVEALVEAGAVGGANRWHEPAAGEIRDAHREACHQRTVRLPTGRRPKRLHGSHVGDRRRIDDHLCGAVRDHACGWARRPRRAPTRGGPGHRLRCVAR